MPQYKVMYFDIKALAEPIRFLFIYGGIDFEDYRYTHDEWTKVLKPSKFPRFTFKQSYLFFYLQKHHSDKVHFWKSTEKFSGRVLPFSAMLQNLWVLRVIPTWKSWKSKCLENLYGMCVAVSFRNNYITAKMLKTVLVLYAYYFGAPESKSLQEENVFKVQLPFMLNRLDKIVSENGGFFVKGKLSWPDLAYTAYYPYLNVMAGKDIEEGASPNLKALREKVSAIPAIKSWIERRPETEWQKLYIFLDFFVVANFSFNFCLFSSHLGFFYC